MEVGQRVLVTLPEIHFPTENGQDCIPDETFEAVVTGIDVPCRIALGLRGMEVQRDNGEIYHIDPAWAMPLK